MYQSLCLPAPTCPEGESYTSDPNDICKFYQCDDFGNVYHMNCTAGTKWDDVEKTCVAMGPGDVCAAPREYT